jgi:hypothetical protein
VEEPAASVFREWLPPLWRNLLLQSSVSGYHRCGGTCCFSLPWVVTTVVEEPAVLVFHGWLSPLWRNLLLQSSMGGYHRCGGTCCFSLPWVVTTVVEEPAASVFRGWLPCCFSLPWVITTVVEEPAASVFRYKIECYSETLVLAISLPRRPQHESTAVRTLSLYTFKRVSELRCK